jgi:hypothetical protein
VSDDDDDDDGHQTPRYEHHISREVSLVVSPLPLPFGTLTTWELSTLYQFTSSLAGLKASNTRFAIKVTSYQGGVCV